MVQTMFELMYEAKGVGLAANQVDLPLRLFVANLKGDPEEGEELVFINPVLTGAKSNEEAEEGCLSLPGLYGNVQRPGQTKIAAYDLSGNEITAELSGLAARVVQHEVDHLDGTLFIDRLSETGRMSAREALEEFDVEFQSKRRTGEIPSDEEIAARLAEIERRYCGTE